MDFTIDFNVEEIDTFVEWRNEEPHFFTGKEISKDNIQGKRAWTDVFNEKIKEKYPC